MSAEVEQPKAKAKARAKSKARAEEPTEPTEPTEAPKPKAKAKPRAKAKAKAVAAEAPLVDEVTEIEPPVNTPEEPPVNTPEEPPVQLPTEPEVVEAATTTRKPKGHRPKIENKEKLTKKVNCKKCDKTVSLHSIKYTHDKFCAPAAAPMQVEEERPLTLREKLQMQRQATAQRLIAQCFKS